MTTKEDMTPMDTTMTTTGSTLPNELTRLGDQAHDYARQSKAHSTLRAYRSDWTHFTRWCDARGRAALPASAETVALYVTDLAATHRPATLTRRLAAISVAHKAAGCETPTASAPVRAVLQGIRRVKGTAPTQKVAAVTADIRAMIGKLRLDTLGGLRDRALLLTGFAGGMRRGELAGLDVGDVEFVHEGATVTIRRSKSDQEGVGARVGLPYGSDPATCPVRALRAWLDAFRVAEGPLLRAVDRHGRLGEGRMSGQAVAEVIKRAAVSIGQDPARYGGHSLRAGMATAAAQAGATEAAIQRQGRWRSLVVRRYVRHGSLYVDNAAAKLGL